MTTLAYTGADAPGTELKILLSGLGIPSCDECSQYADQMDTWGVDGCRERLAEITAWLRAQAAKMSWSQWFDAAAMAAAGGPGTWFNPFNPAPGLAAEAIRLAAARPAHLGCIGPGCPICPKLAQHGRERAKAHLTGRPLVAPLPCIHFGEATGEHLLTGCSSCGGGGETTAPIYRCDLHGDCSPTVRDYPGVRGCQGCPTRTYAAPTRAVRVNPARLTLGEAGAAFNASIADYRGRRLLCYRTGWAGAQLHVAELVDDLQPRGEVVTLTGLDLAGVADHGREDPRLFLHRGRLHVAYIGVTLDPSGSMVTHQCYARLRDDLTTEHAWQTQYAARTTWEKNWGFFSWQQELFAVYGVQPHVILHVKDGACYPFAETAGRVRWTGGVLRGGAAPVRVGDEYWHWFHGRVEAGQPGPDGKPAKLVTYTAGCYTFEAKPPFRITRMTPAPLVWGERKTVPAGGDKAVVFPCGAVLDGDRWLVSAGIHDRWIEIFEFDKSQVERAMVAA